MTTRELTYVLTAAREKSFQTAAQKLQMSQSTLSRSVQKIETELGCALFVRAAQGLLLTDAGRRYTTSAQQILQLERELQADISRINNLAAGRLTVGVTGYLGTYLLPTLLRTFGTMFPGIEVLFEEADSLTVEQRLLAGEADVALLHLPLALEGIVAQPVAADEYLLVLPETDPAANEARPASDGLEPFLPLSMVARRNFVLMASGQRSRQRIDEIFAQAEITPRVKYNTRSPHTALAFAQAGLGVTLCTRSSLRMYRQEKDALKICRIPGQNTNVTVAVCWAERLARSAAVGEFAKVCVATLPYLYQTKPILL